MLLVIFISANLWHKIGVLEIVDFGSMNHKIICLSASTWQCVYMILVQMRLKSWFLIMILENNLHQVTLKLNLHFIYHKMVVMVFKQIKHCVI
jgi:hypothetical protein